MTEPADAQPRAAFRFVCTGRDTHPVTRAVNYGEPRRGPWPDSLPVLIRSAESPKSSTEYSCDLCRCNLRIGGRLWARMREAQKTLAESGKTGDVVPVDISRPEDLPF